MIIHLSRIMAISLLLVAYPALTEEYPLQPGDEILPVLLESGVTLPLYIHEPEGTGPDMPVLIVMHGNSRDADRYFHQWRALSDRYGFYLLVPEFSRQQYPKSAQYNLGNVFNRRVVNKEDDWSFSAIGQVFDAFRKAMGTTAARYDIYGHSAGAQFVHRFLLHVPDARVNRYVAANAGWYTLPQFEQKWPYGLSGSLVDLGMRAKALQKQLAY